METSSSPAESQSVFTGTIESITKVEAEEETIQIKVTGVKSKEDPANIGTSFSNDGVLLNAAPEQIREGADALKSGVEITFTLVKMPVMTMSIPPQIPGDSIIEITVNK